MQRRNFLKGSVVGAGTLITSLGRGNRNADAAGSSAAFDQGQTSTSGWVEVPGTSYEVTDTLTKVPVTVTIGKFLMASKELTQREFEEVMGYNPSFHQGRRATR